MIERIVSSRRAPRARLASLLAASLLTVGLSAASLLAVSLLTVSVGLAFGTSTALAQKRSAEPPAHSSHLRITGLGAEPLTRRVTIGVDKSMLVEVPTDLTNVLVSNPEVLDAVVQTSRQVYLLAKDVGEANAFLLGPDGQKVLFLEVTVTRDVTALNETIARLLPGSRVKVEMVGENVVLSGTVLHPVDANRAGELASKFVKKKENVVNMIGTAAKEQVLLRVKVAEMARDAIRRIGVDLPAATLATGQFAFTQVIRNAMPVTGAVVPEAIALGAGVPPAVFAGKALQGTWESSSGNQSVSAMLQLLERSGLVRTLAEPNLTALSGEQAKFLAGGEFPIPVSQSDDRITVEWKQFGVNVTFKPVVMSEGRISLAVSAEVSELTNEGAVVIGALSLPGLKVRRAETTLEMPSGGTLAMAGLLSDETRQGVEGIPGLKNLPVLGALFRSNDYRRRETELVILVTPTIATHANARDMARPTDGFQPEQELKELFFGHLNRVYGRPAVDPRGRYHGDYGFIVSYPGVKG